MADCQEQGDLSSKISGWQIYSIGSKLAGHQNKDTSHNLRCWCSPPRDSQAAMYDKYHIIGFVSSPTHAQECTEQLWDLFRW